MRRAHFLGAGAALSAAAAAAPARALVPRPAAGYPDFSWERVPYAAQMGKFRGDFTPAECAFIANHFAFIAVGPGTGLGDKPASNAFRRPDSSERERDQTRESGLQSALLLGRARATSTITRPTPVTTRRGGFRTTATGDAWKGDASNAAFRGWWARSAAQIVAHDDVDGVFVDGANPEGDHPFHTMMLQGLREELTALPKPALLLINGVPAPGKAGLPSMLDLCDGIMIEYFGIVGKKDPANSRNTCSTSPA